MNIAEGDANTEFFHLHACHRKRKSYVDKVQLNDAVLIQEDEKAQAFFNFYDDLLGTPSAPSLKLDFAELGIPSIDLPGIDSCFTEEEVWHAIQETHPEKAPGPNGFTGTALHGQ